MLNRQEPEWSYDLLRQKWGTVPAGHDRVRTGDLLNLADAELLATWEQAHAAAALGGEWAHRGWFHDLYRDRLTDRRVLDVGCGFGLSTIHFAQHGARVTFADIVEDNVNRVRRIYDLKSITADFIYIKTSDSFNLLDND